MSPEEIADAALRKWRGGGNVGDTDLDVAVRDACIASAAESERLALVFAEPQETEERRGDIQARLQDLVDENFGTIPTAPIEKLLGILEERLRELPLKLEGAASAERIANAWADEHVNKPSPRRCPACHKWAPCTRFDEVDIGVGIQVGNECFECICGEMF